MHYYLVRKEAREARAEGEAEDGLAELFHDGGHFLKRDIFSWPLRHFVVDSR